MPSHKGALKNTKTRKVRVIYDHQWEHDYQCLRKFLSSDRGRGKYYGATPSTTLEMIEPGKWRFGASVGWINMDGVTHRSTNRNSNSGYGRTPEEAFKSWWVDTVDSLPEGCALYYTAGASSYSYRRISTEAYKIFGISPRTSKWAWLPPLVIRVKEA